MIHPETGSVSLGGISELGRPSALPMLVYHDQDTVPPKRAITQPREIPATSPKLMSY